MEYLRIIFIILSTYLYFRLISYLIMKRYLRCIKINDFLIALSIINILSLIILVHKYLLFNFLMISILIYIEVFILKTTNKNKSIIIKNGKINFNELIKKNYSLDNLFKDLKFNEVKNIEDIEYAYLKRNGNLVVVCHNKLL